MLVIDPDECIDCGVCEPECPANAIVPDTDKSPDVEFWLDLNKQYAKVWPNITQQIDPLPEADEYNPAKGYNGDPKGNMFSGVGGKGKK